MIRHIRILILFSVMCVLGIGEASAQMPIKHIITPALEPDSADAAHYGRDHFWRAAAEVGGMNVGLWLFDRFVQHGDFAYISPRTMWANLHRGFFWDNDQLGTNMFLHPYNGSLFFNAGRSNGFNYWQSGLFAIAGSSMWELFMEREYPSTNDIIATPIGGMAIGEVCFRISDLVLDDRAEGWDRFGREAGAFVISPMRGITRILTGDAWHRRATSGKMFGTPAIGLELGGGVRVISFRNNHRVDTRAGMALRLNVSYGDRFSLAHSRPYDYFLLNAEVSMVSRQPVLSQLSISGRLLSRELRDNERTHASIGLYQHFIFYDSDTLSSSTAKCPYKLGIPACVGGGLLYRHELPRTLAVDAFAHVNAVLLGGVLSDYYMVDERNYNLAMGYSFMAGGHLVLGRDRLAVTLSHELYRMFTFKGYPEGTDLNFVNYRTLNAMGDKSTATFGVTKLELEARVWKRLYVSAGVIHYFRTTHYHYPDLKNVRSSTFGQTVALNWKF